MNARHCLTVTVTVRAPFLFPGLATGLFGLDSTQLRDECGQPVLPAAQIQGILREALGDLAAAAPAVVGAGDIRNLFGDASVKDSNDEPIRGRLLLSDLAATGHPLDERRIVRVEIDDALGAAKTGHLHVIEEIARPGRDVEFTGSAILFWPVGDGNRIVGALDKAIRLISAIGAYKSAGFGEVVAKACSVVVAPSVARAPPAPRGAGMRIGLAAKFDRPILVDAERVVDNAFAGSEIVPGGVFKGALARKVEQMLGSAAVGDYAAALTSLRFSHAFPEDRCGDPGGAPLPLSTVATKPDAGFKFGDALCLDGIFGLADDRGPRIGAEAALFQLDWKPGWPEAARVDAGLPLYDPRRPLPRTHTAIGPGGVAAEHQLFSTIARSVLCPWDQSSPRRFLLSVDLNDVADKERGEMLVALLLEGLDGIGRTGASVRFDPWPQAALPPPVACVLGRPDLFAVVLRTPAVLTDPRTELTAMEAYQAYWEHVVPGAKLADFYAVQRLAGGYLATRYRPWGKPYHPFLLTDAGSVFLLRGSIAGRLEELAQSGLPLPSFKGASRLTWQNCPFVPENGYGAFRADHLSDAAGPRWSAEVCLG